MIGNSPSPIDTAHSVVECCFAACVGKKADLVRIRKFAAAAWLLSLHSRGRAALSAGRYALMVFAQALHLGIPANSPAALSAVRSHIARLAKHAPRLALRMLLLFAQIDAYSVPFPLQYFAACLMLMALASFRFPDAGNIRDVTFKNGASTDHVYRPET